jgi:anti-sigma B factor antagonist
MLNKVETVEQDVTVAYLQGRLNVGSNLMFLEGDLKKLVENGARKVIVDMSGVDYVDSAGLGVLVGVAGILRTQGGELKAAGLQQRVADVFQMTRLTKVIEVHSDVSAAAKTFQA